MAVFVAVVAATAASTASAESAATTAAAKATATTKAAAVAAATTASSAKSTATAAKATATSTAIVTGASDVHLDFLSVDGGAVQLADGPVGSVLVNHGDEGVALASDVNILDLAASKIIKGYFPTRISGCCQGLTRRIRSPKCPLDIWR